MVENGAPQAQRRAARREVADPVADERHRVGVEVGHHHLAPLARIHRLAVAEHFDQDAVVAGVEVARVAALPADQRAFVAGVGLGQRRAERLADPEPHRRRGDLAADDHQPRTHRRALRRLSSGAVRRSSIPGRPTTTSGCAVPQLGRDIGRLLKSVDQMLAMESHGAERAARPASCRRPAGRPPTPTATTRSRCRTPSARKRAEPEQVLELVLQPGAADGERLAGRAAGADA